MGVVPIADLVDVAPRRQARPGRHADRAVGIGLIEARAAGGQIVKNRSPHDGVAVTVRDLLSVLVRKNEQQIPWCHI